MGRPIASVLSLFVACGGCHCAETAVPGGDAAADAIFRQDAALDAGSDVADAAAWDGPIPEDWPGWRRLVELDPDCIADIPKDISALPPLKWIPCPAQLGACQQVDTTGWLQPDAGTTAIVPVAYPGQNDQWIFIYNWLTRVSWQVTLYEIASGKALAAWRADTCAPSGHGGLTQLAVFESLKYAYSVGTPAEQMTAPIFHRILPKPVGDVNGNESASDTTLAFPVYPPKANVRVNLLNNSFVTSTTGLPEFVVVWKDDVFTDEYNTSTGWPRYLRFDPDGSLVPFIDRKTRSVARLATDGQRLWWLEADGAYPGDLDPPSVEVWTAPYTNDGPTAMATAVKVATFVGPRLWAGGAIPYVTKGIYMFWGGNGPTYLVRGSDFKTKVVAPGSPDYSLGPAWTDGVELWGILSKQPSGPFEIGFARVQIGPW